MKTILVIYLFLIMSCQQPSISVMSKKQNTISQISVRTGNADFRGQYSLEIEPHNSQVSFTHGNETLRYSIKEDSIYKRAIQKIGSFDPTNLTSSVKNATPGDEKIFFTIVQNGEVRSTSLWLNERWTNEELKKWFEFSKTLIEEISNGELFYK